MRLPLVLSLLLLAGCLQGPGSEPAPTEPASRPTDDAFLQFRKCGELDYYYPVDVGRHRLPGLRAKTTDPAGRVTNELVNAMKCESAETRNGSTLRPHAWFLMLNVEPHSTLRLANVSAYVWIVRATTPDALIRDYFGAGSKVGNGTMELTFEAGLANGAPQSRGILEIRMSDGTRIGVRSHMSGNIESGKAGSMAAYTGTSESDLRLHRIDFSDYRFYRNGVATASEGAVPISVQEGGQPVPAYHNLDYDVRFSPASALPK